MNNGNINKLIEKNSVDNSTISDTSDNSTSSFRSEITALIDALGISSVPDYDEPLDPMEICNEEEMTTFLNTHPGLEDDYDEEDPNLPEPQKTDPTLFQGFDMEGVPDQFRPGNWRETDIMDRLDDVSDDIKEAFGKLLDKHVNTISYHSGDGRPVFLNGKPVTVDVELEHYNPIFIKPYTIPGAEVEALDKNISRIVPQEPLDSGKTILAEFTRHPEDAIVK